MSVYQAVERELEWRQPEALRHFYRLTQVGREIAALRVEKNCGSWATGVRGQAKWAFQSTVFLSPRIPVREAGAETGLALFTPGWIGSGSAAFSSSRR